MHARLCKSPGLNKQPHKLMQRVNGFPSPTNFKRDYVFVKLCREAMSDDSNMTHMGTFAIIKVQLSLEV